MDGKGCWRDNVFIERLWKSVKYEEVYLHAYYSVPTAKQALERYFNFYAPKEVPLGDNHHRPHSALDGKTPDMAYFNFREPLLTAAA